MAAAKAATKPKTAVALRPGTNVATMEADIKRELATLGDRVGAPSGDAIQIGLDKTFKLPNGVKSNKPIDIVIVDFATARYFYEGAYDPKNITPPACFALATSPKEMVPSKDAPNKQASSCNVCPMNEFGSNGNGKACKEYRVVACLPPDADVDTPLYILKVSATALKGFDSYVTSIAAKFDTLPFGVITEVSFDEKADYPTLVFGNPRPVEADMKALAYNMRGIAKSRLAKEPDVTGYKAPAPARGKRK